MPGLGRFRWVITQIKVKRIDEPPVPEDGCRVLVERLWPRGIRRNSLKLDIWAKELGASDALRRWYGHIPERWPEFLARYRSELQERPEHWEKMAALARDGPLTLLYSARDESRNNAVALRAFLLEQLRCGQD
jgi:uncharacterized protein YeaO (DUF488 family)